MPGNASLEKLYAFEYTSLPPQYCDLFFTTVKYTLPLMKETVAVVPLEIPIFRLTLFFWDLVFSENISDYLVSKKFEIRAYPLVSRTPQISPPRVSRKIFFKKSRVETGGGIFFILENDLIN